MTFFRAAPAPLGKVWRLGLELALFANLLATGPASAYHVYVTNEKGNSISVIDTEQQKVVQTAPVGRRPRGVTVSPDGKVLYVCASDENGVEVIDTATMKVLRTLDSGPDPEQFIMHPSGNPLYIANENDAVVTVLDVVKNQIVATVPVGVEPEGMGLRRATSSSPACWSTSDRAMRSSTRTAPGSGSVRKSAAASP
jgi:YVTN family beta-propeller protein